MSTDEFFARIDPEQLIQSTLSGVITEEKFAEELEKMNTDDAIHALKNYGFTKSAGKIVEFFKEFTAKHPDLVKRLRENKPK